MATGATKPFVFAALATAATLAGIGGYALIESHRPAVLELFIFNTPGNPAVFIRTPNDKRILVNGGSNSEIIERISGILPFYSRRIDMVIATNDDPKNVTGLIDVANRYSVDKVVIPAVSLQSLGLASSSNPIYETFLAAIDSHKIPIQEVEAGQRLILDQPANGSSSGSNNGRSIISQLTSQQSSAGPVRQSDVAVNEPVIADILFPVISDSNAATTTSVDSNSSAASTSSKPFQYSNASAPQILMRINYGSTSFALMSDASIKVQKFIAANNELLADALIISNSAIASNIASQLIDSLTPDYLIYSQQLLKGTVSNTYQSTQKKSSASSKSKPKIDPLAGILSENRFNVREKGMVKIVSDGMTIEIGDQ